MALDMEKQLEETSEAVTLTKGELLQLIGLSRVAANRIYKGTIKDSLNRDIEAISEKYIK